MQGQEGSSASSTGPAVPHSTLASLESGGQCPGAMGFGPAFGVSQCSRASPWAKRGAHIEHTNWVRFLSFQAKEAILEMDSYCKCSLSACFSLIGHISRSCCILGKLCLILLFQGEWGSSFCQGLGVYCKTRGMVLLAGGTPTA